jgi:type IV pilus assembly protein PilW
MSASKRRQLGVTLVELMTGLTIGSLVVIGIFFVYAQGRSTYITNESVARLQENGRYALSVLEADIQMAGFYGYTNRTSRYYWVDAAGQQGVARTEQADLPAIAGAASLCGGNFMIDLLRTVQGSNDDYNSGTGCAPNPAPDSTAAVALTDTLTVRRASSVAIVPQVPTVRRIQIYSNRLANSNQFIFNSNALPQPIAAGAVVDLRNLIVRTYFLGQNSRQRANFPTLWRKNLDAGAAAPTVLEEEILPGVEDFQVQFGIDTGDHNGDGTIDKDVDRNGRPDRLNGVVSRWVQPNDPLMLPPPLGRSAQVAAVRVWLRIRAEQPEVGFVDNLTYTYAGRPTFDPAGPGQEDVRRVLMSRTIYVRNTRIL